MAVTSNFSVASTASGGQSAAVTLQRIVSVDMLRGLVMVIMALDHTRDYFSNVPFPPEDLTRTSGILFFTRFITHYCAPVFFLLAGTGAFLATARGMSIHQISHFLWTRGLWLMFLELTVVGFGWTFVLPFTAASILWALGWSMVALSVFVRLPIRWIAGIGLTMIACHNLLDRVNPAWFGKSSWLWMLLHSPGFYPVNPNFGVLVLYPVIPWIGVMAAGYSLGSILLRPDRKKLLLRIGIAITTVFFLLRGINHYGNGIAGLPFGMPIGVGPWSVQGRFTLTVASFVNTLKYPPSLDFLLMTLGPALIALALFDGLNTERGIGRVLLVFGRVPMFYYVLHIYLIHLMAILVAEMVHQPVAWLWRGGFFFSSTPRGYGHDLPFVYAMWILAVLVLYLPCRRFMEFKKRHPDWNWLSYL
jgi:uncharacterized membrane protein